jgi:hydrogenase nickel incorporation protein HypA/HybF
VDQDVVDQGFRLAAAGTVLEGATLELIVEPVTARCRRCGNRTAAHDALALAACPACGGVDVDVPGDEEVTVDSIAFASSIQETPGPMTAGAADGCR